MKRPLFCLAVVLLVSRSMSASMDEVEMAGDGEAAVHIVYVDRPEAEEPEAFHIRTLASVVGSEDAAKEALIYHYKHAASGFSAKLTPKQVSDLSKKPEVLQVMPDRIYELHTEGGGIVGGLSPAVL